jgi:hypothetical protein
MLNDAEPIFFCSEIWEVFHGLSMLPGEYSIPEIYHVPTVPKISPHVHVKDMPAVSRQFQPSEVDLHHWSAVLP